MQHSLNCGRLPTIHTRKCSSLFFSSNAWLQVHSSFVKIMSMKQTLFPLWQMPLHCLCVHLQRIIINRFLCSHFGGFAKDTINFLPIRSNITTQWMDVLTERINLPSLSSNLGSVISKNLKTVLKISPLLRAEKLPLAFPIRPFFSSAFHSFKQSWQSSFTFLSANLSSIWLNKGFTCSS